MALPPTNTLELMEIRDSIASLPPPSLLPDSVVWLPSKGVFNSASTWDALKAQAQPLNWCHLVWFSKNIPRCSFITWLAVLNMLKTMDRLHVSVASTACVFCRLESEDHDHLFFRCPFTLNLWSSLITNCGESYSSVNWNTYVERVASQWDKAGLRGWILKICLTCAVYTIWRERNARVFSNSYRDSQSLRKALRRMVFCKLLSNSKVDENTRRVFLDG